MAETNAEAEQYAVRLCELNTERQHIESAMFEEALEMARMMPNSTSPIVLASENWHLGVAGIVASRLAERLSRPSVIICIADGVGRGSCRSVAGYSIHSALEKRSDMLVAFGGHELAAGLTIEEGRITEFRDSFTAEETLAADGVVLEIDLEVIKPGLLTTANVEALSVLEPYGTGNPQPVLCIREALIESALPICSGKHSKFRIHKNGETFDGIFFGKTLEELDVKDGDRADLAFNPQLNEYRGRRSVQLHLVDIFPVSRR